MNLHSGDPYWLIKNGFLASYQKLEKNISADIVIIGGGITAALMAYNIRRLTGRSITVIESRHIGLGSTCASTALLQYEIDTTLNDLSKTMGKKGAEEIYLLCYKALNEIHEINRELAADSKFEFVKSLYIASKKRDIASLKRESLARKEIGIRSDYLGPEELKNLFGIKAYGALHSKKAAQLDPLVFTHAIFNQLSKNNVCIYDQTTVKKVKEYQHKVVLKCEGNYSVTCKKVIFANGYESQLFLKDKISRLSSTYAIISKPIAQVVPFFKTQIWETARPYHYIRSTKDKRLIIGGKDETFSNAEKRDELLRKKARLLEKEFKKRFPLISFQTDFAWTGTFADTEDGLPFIGKTQAYRHLYFALGFGGNGIVFGQVAAVIISELITGKRTIKSNPFDFTTKRIKL